ncbi:MAG: EF-hand domain-containing protein [Euryarchaeota archaeon]
MALALVTTTFAGVSYADPATGTSSADTIADMDYDELDMIVDFDANGTTYTGLTAEIHVYDNNNFSAWFGPEDMMEESDNTSWNTHWADISLALFFEGSPGVSPTAEEDTWYYVDAYVDDSNGYNVGLAYTEICMVNGSACDTSTDDTEAEDTFNEIDVDGDGAITGQELIDFWNMELNAENESALNSTEETELLEEMAEWDTGWTSMDGNDTEDANDSMLEFNEFLAWYDSDDGGPTTAEFSLSNGYLYIWFYEEGDWSYATVELQDNNGNTVYNGTSTNSSWSIDMEENNLTDNEYWVTFTLILADGTVISIIQGWVSDYDYDQMMFDMYDTDMSGNISVDEFLDAMDNMSEEVGEEPMDNSTRNMITNLFLSEDMNDDMELDLYEFLSFLYEMDNMGDDDSDEEGYELMMMMLDADQDGNITLSEILVMVEENQSDASQMTTFYTNIFNNADVDGNGMLDDDEFYGFYEVVDELMGDYCYEVMAGDAILAEGTFEDEEGYETDLMAGDTAPSDGEFCEWTDIDSDAILLMSDTNGDDQLSLSEILASMTSGDETAEELMMLGWIFEFHDANGDGLLDHNEFGDFYMHMQSGEEYIPTPAQMMVLIDADGDGSVSLTETIAFLNADAENQDETLSTIEEEYLGVLFGFMDADSNGLLNASEFPEFYYALDSEEDEGDMGGDDGEETEMVCYDIVNHVVIGGFTDATSCETAGYLWTDMSQSPGDGGDGNQSTGDDDNQGVDIDFDTTDVWFEQWNDQTMQLVLVELAVIDNAEEIQSLSMMADAMYGNNDSVLDQSEVEMLMALYAMSLNVDDISQGLTLDGTNGTAVDFWVEIDGLLEGDDVVFIRIGTVIEFPVTDTYDNSTSHTFVVDNTDVEDDGGAGEDFTEDEVCEYTVRVHNSESWDISSVVTTGDELVFTYEETNNMWYGENDNCDASGTITFNLVKVEDSAMPEEEDEDWTWEDEEMNLLPICDWFYSVTFANGTMMSEQGVDEATGGDRIITLADDAAYEIGIYCWDPEGGNMTVTLSSPLGNSTNTSMGYAWSWMNFALPAGTGGNFSIDISWTDGYHAESGTLTVIATGDGSTGDISDVEVTSEGMPGFTSALGVLAFLGAAVLSGRRD